MLDNYCNDINVNDIVYTTVLNYYFACDDEQYVLHFIVNRSKTVKF